MCYTWNSFFTLVTIHEFKMNTMGIHFRNEQFCSDQGRTRVCDLRSRDRKAYVFTPQPETRGERRSGQKWSFMDGHKL